METEKNNKVTIMLALAYVAVLAVLGVVTYELVANTSLWDLVCEPTQKASPGC